MTRSLRVPLMPSSSSLRLGGWHRVKASSPRKRNLFRPFPSTGRSIRTPSACSMKVDAFFGSTPLAQRSSGAASCDYTRPLSARSWVAWDPV